MKYGEKALQEIRAIDQFAISEIAALATIDFLAAHDIEAKIKWPNDIYVGDRKICGILIENTFSGKNITSSVVGLGLNIYNELPQELKEIATTVLEQTGKRYEVKQAEEILLSFLQKGVKDKYESYLGFIGEEVRLLSGEKEFSGIVLGVDKQGNLLARVDGKDCVFASAEVQIVKN
jgi:BirA family biotin operon repressor/biotin-[acetyl-CoA-carboxylase] ligase